MIWSLQSVPLSHFFRHTDLMHYCLPALLSWVPSNTNPLEDTGENRVGQPDKALCLVPDFQTPPPVFNLCIAVCTGRQVRNIISIILKSHRPCRNREQQSWCHAPNKRRRCCGKKLWWCFEKGRDQPSRDCIAAWSTNGNQ